MARPSKYTPEVVDRICEGLIEGSSLRQLCCQEGMPSRATILRWANDKPEFQKRYQLACQIRAEGLADDMIDIADDASRDWKQVGNRRVLNKDVIRRDRLRIKTRKWMVNRMQLKKHRAWCDGATAPTPNR